MTPDRDAEIAARAHTMWEHEGRPSGRELEHWLRAEAEYEATQHAKMLAAQHAKMAKADAPKQRPAPKRNRRSA
jgi:hypothetical protein